MDSTTISCLSQPPFQLLNGEVQRAIEICGAGLTPDYGSARSARYLHMLAAVVLPSVSFVV
jgi:hypothetical protein